MEQFNERPYFPYSWHQVSDLELPFCIPASLFQNQSHDQVKSLEYDIRVKNPQ